jgi:hypothetical protein
MQGSVDADVIRLTIGLRDCVRRSSLDPSIKCLSRGVSSCRGGFFFESLIQVLRVLGSGLLIMPLTPRQMRVTTITDISKPKPMVASCYFSPITNLSPPLLRHLPPILLEYNDPTCGFDETSAWGLFVKTSNSIAVWFVDVLIVSK